MTYSLVIRLKKSYGYLKQALQRSIRCIPLQFFTRLSQILFTVVQVCDMDDNSNGLDAKYLMAEGIIMNVFSYCFKDYHFLSVF